MSILRSLLILSAVSVGVTAGGWPIQHRETDVVIIGGGSSGTYAATRLTRMGHDVVVIENDQFVEAPGRIVIFDTRQLPISAAQISFSVRHSIWLTPLNSLASRPA